MSATRRSAAACAATPQPFFRTANIDAAAYLIVHHKLRYVDARFGGDNHSVTFLIEDPNKNAEQLARSYVLDSPEPVEPRALLQVHAFLRNEIQRVRKGAR